MDARETVASPAAEGFLLLSIPNVTITSTSAAHPLGQPLVGLLSLECITVNVADPLERDVWLILRVEPPKNSPVATFELPLPSTQRVLFSRSNNQYTLPMNDGGDLVLSLSPAITAAQKEDLETLEVILAQYLVLEIQDDGSATPGGSMANFSPDGDLKGRLVLVDEDNGQVVATLGDQFDIREDQDLRARGSEKTPVVVELPDENDPVLGPRVKREIFVHTISVDDNDWVSKTAGFLG